MEPWMERMNAWLSGEIALCEERRAALAADAREDEAVFEKIRANVYGIFRTILFAAQHACENGENAQRFCEDKLEQIPEKWTAAYEEAKRHGDISRMVMESIKLDTARKIRETLMREVRR